MNTFIPNPMCAFFGLGGFEIVIILFVLLVGAAFWIGVIWFAIRLLKSLEKRNRPPQVPPSVPVTVTGSRCPQCGKVIASDSPQGLCPACLMKAGLGSHFGEAGEPPKNPGPAMTLEELSRLFPQLELLELLGQGGMGTVYKARQSQLDRLVALKILSPQLSRDPAFAERFSREAKALARLNHPNIVGVYDFGKAGDLYYFIMEYVDGMNLWQLEQSKKRLSPEEAFAIVPKICDALQYAHDEGVVHRDIKPGNILIDKKGRVKIADFGLAKLLGKELQPLGITQSRVLMGTPHYMAPEQIEKPLQVDHRADIYSLGVVFYEMLTGELPIGRFAPPSQKVQIDVRLDDVVLRTLEKEPQRRYQQAGEVKTDVEKVAGSGTKPAVNPHVSGKSGTTWKLGLFLILIVVGLISISLFVRSRVSRRMPSAVVSPVMNPESLPSSVSASQIINLTLQKYKSADSFYATGTSVAEIRYPDSEGRQPFSVLSSFSIHLQRPSSCLIKWDEVVTPTYTSKGAVWSDGEQSFKRIDDNLFKLADFQTALHSDDQSFGESTKFIPGLFFEKGSNWLSRVTQWTLDPEEAVNSENCYVIRGLLDTDQVTVWIRKKDFLVKQRRRAVNMTSIQPPELTDEEIARRLGPGVTTERIERWKMLSRNSYFTTQNIVMFKTDLFEQIEVDRPMSTNLFHQSSTALAKSEEPVEPAKATTNGPAIWLRNPAATADLIDLSLFYNLGFNDDMGSKTLFENNLANLPHGLQEFGGTKFDVRGILQLASLNSDSYIDFPKQFTGIPVERSAARLHLLGGTCWTDNDGTQTAKVILHYVDGSIQELPLTYGEHFRDWTYISDQTEEATRAKVVWAKQNAVGRIVRIYKTTIENPRPDRKIQTLDFVSNMSNAAAFVIAVTAE